MVSNRITWNKWSGATQLYRLKMLEDKPKNKCNSPINLPIDITSKLITLNTSNLVVLRMKQMKNKKKNRRTLKNPLKLMAEAEDWLEETRIKGPNQVMKKSQKLKVTVVAEMKKVKVRRRVMNKVIIRGEELGVEVEAEQLQQQLLNLQEVGEEDHQLMQFQMSTWILTKELFHLVHQDKLEEVQETVVKTVLFPNLDLLRNQKLFQQDSKEPTREA